MSTDAVIMLIVAIAVVWGGLALAITALRRHPDEPDDPDPPSPRSRERDGSDVAAPP